MGLLTYFIRRIILVALVIFGVITITFVLARYVPGDPVLVYLGERARQEQIDAMRKKWGLDKPVFEQYVIFIENLFRGDLGISITTQHPVVQDLGVFLPYTLDLATSGLVVSLVIGIPLGVASALHKNKMIDNISRIMSLIGSSAPIFWLGLLELGLFYFKLGWLPGPGFIDVRIPPPNHITGSPLVDSLLTGNWPALSSVIAYLVLPALACGAYATAITARMVRSSMLEVLGQDFIRTARAKGLPRAVVTFKHALRNAMIPCVTVIGLNYGVLLSGAIITETVFNRPGLGNYAMNSMLTLDYPAIVGCTLVIALIYVFVNLVVDIIYALIDPTIRYV